MIALASRSRSILRPYSRCKPGTAAGSGLGASCSISSTMGCELGLGQQSGRQEPPRAAVGGTSDDDDRVKTDGGKLRLERVVVAQSMFDEIRVRPLDLNVLSDQQPVVGAQPRSHQ